MGPRPERARAAGESGQAIVEFVLVLPVVALLLGVAFNGWSSMDLSVGLTSAARAGAIQAAYDLGGSSPGGVMTSKQAQDAATAAVNAEEGQTTLYQDSNSGAGNYVNLQTQTETTTQGTTIQTVTITITSTPVALVPFVHSLSVTASATARYS